MMVSKKRQSISEMNSKNHKLLLVAMYSLKNKDKIIVTFYSSIKIILIFDVKLFSLYCAVFIMTVKV